MRLGHALLSVFVREDSSSCGAKMCIVVGMVEVSVGVDDVFHRCAAKTIESFFEPGPGGCNESVHKEFAVWAVEYCYGSAWTVEHGDIVSKLLRFHGNGIELGAHIREKAGRRKRLLGVARCGGEEQPCGEEVRQKGAASQGSRNSEHFAA